MKNRVKKWLISSMLAGFTSIYSIAPNSSVYSIIIGVLLIFFLSFYLLGRVELAEKLSEYKTTKKYKKILILLATFLSTLTTVKYTFFIWKRIQDEPLPNGQTLLLLIPDIVLVIVALIIIILSSFTFFLLWYLLIKQYLDRVILFFKRLGVFEKGVVYSFMLLFSFINMIILINTNAFVFPLHNGEIIYDVIFTTDTAALVYEIDVFSSPGADQNDIRHLLFGIIGIPLAMICQPITYLVKGITIILGMNISVFTLYGYFLSVTQAFLFSMSGLLLYKMLSNVIVKQFAKLFFIGYLLSYSTLLFTITVEQYALATFTILLFVYQYMQKADSKFSYIIASLSITTSFAMLPFVLLENNRNLKKIVKTSIYLVTVVLLLLIFFGQLNEVLRASSTITHLSKFSHDESITFLGKLDQFLGFVPAMFVAPNVVMTTDRITLGSLSDPVRMLSLFILSITLLSMIINRHLKLTIISAYWVFISFLILVIIGWGSVEHSMVLYSSYFTWAYLILLALIFNKLFNRRILLGSFILIVMILLLFTYNSMEFVTYILRLSSLR